MASPLLCSLQTLSTMWCPFSTLLTLASTLIRLLSSEISRPLAQWRRRFFADIWPDRLNQFCGPGLCAGHPVSSRQLYRGGSWSDLLLPWSLRGSSIVGGGGH